MIRVEHWLRESARRDPTRTAIACNDGQDRISWQELDTAADRFAAALEADGFRRGDRCVLFLDNRIETAIALFGVLRAGGVFSVVNPLMKAGKLGWILADCEPAAVVTQAALLEVVQEATADLTGLNRIVVADGGEGPRCTGWDAFLASAPQPAPQGFAGIDIDLCMLVYTSGSTGTPKGVMMTHANVVFAATSVTTYLEMHEGDVVFSVLPLAFDYGLYQLLMCTRVGATLVLERSFAFPQKVLPLLEREQVTVFPLVPTIAALLLQMRSFRPEWAAPVRALTNTAAALPPAHIERLQELFPNARVFSMYGMTESKRCTWLPPAELAARPGSVGIAIPGTEVWVAGNDGQPLPPGEVGELVVRGGHVMQGYWRNPEATAQALGPGRYPWEKVLRTGDLFRMDADGYCWFVGRKDDILKSRGEKVSPKEIENVLYALDGVAEAAVVGVPDPVLGMALKALIVTTPEADLQARQVIAHCLAHLEDFMVPRLIEFREALPKTPTGKIRRAALQAEAEGRTLDE